MLDRTELAREQAIIGETDAVCGRLGAPHGSTLFVPCAIELDGVRQHERARIAVEASGLP